MTARKSIKDYWLGHELNAEEVAALFTNKVVKAWKSAPSWFGYFQPKYRTDWFLKKLTAEEYAIGEVVAQEIFRLVLPRHPKTRLVQDEKGQFKLVASKKIAGNSQCLDEVRGEDKRYFFQKGIYKGLGEIMVMALFVSEHDLKFGNLFVNENNELIKIDGDLCLYVPNNSTHDITTADIQRLPFVRDYKAGNWVDIRYDKRFRKSYCFNKNDGWNEQFRYEVNATLLKVLSLPKWILSDMIGECLVCYSGQDQVSRQIFDYLVERQQQLKNAALQNQSFKTFLLSDDAKKEFKNFFEQLQRFHPRGKLTFKVAEARDRMFSDFALLRRCVQVEEERKTAGYDLRFKFGKRKAEMQATYRAVRAKVR